MGEKSVLFRLVWVFGYLNFLKKSMNQNLFHKEQTKQI